jgi:hypothetical protein
MRNKLLTLAALESQRPMPRIGSALYAIERWLAIGVILVIAAAIGIAVTLAADASEDAPIVAYERGGKKLIRLPAKPADAIPVVDRRPIRRRADGELRRLEADQVQSGLHRFPDKDENQLRHEAADDRRPALRQSEDELRRIETERHRPGRRLVKLRPPEEGGLVVE